MRKAEGEIGEREERKKLLTNSFVSLLSNVFHTSNLLYLYFSNCFLIQCSFFLEFDRQKLNYFTQLN